MRSRPHVAVVAGPDRYERRGRCRNPAHRHPYGDWEQAQAVGCRPDASRPAEVAEKR